MSPVDVAVLASVIGSIVMFGGAAVLAMGWAFRNGQFENFREGALSIFGPDEPVGEMTDAFPSQQPVTPEREDDVLQLSEEEVLRLPARQQLN